MRSSFTSRHTADATLALLVAARSSIDSAIVALTQAKGLIAVEPDPAELQPVPPSKASLPARRAPKPRAARKVASVGGAGSVAAPSVAPAWTDEAIERHRVELLRRDEPEPAAGRPPRRTFTDDSTIAPAPAAAVLAWLDTQGGSALARAIVEAVSGSTKVKDHGKVYDALKALVAAGALAQDGRRYTVRRP
jgi:hypothetical protein